MRSGHRGDDLQECIESLEAEGFLVITPDNRESIMDRFEAVTVNPFAPNCLNHHDRTAVVSDTSPDNARHGRFVPLCMECAFEEASEFLNVTKTFDLSGVPIYNPEVKR